MLTKHPQRWKTRGLVQVVGVPFAAGTQVEVTISPKRQSAEEFTAAWRRICAELRGRPGLQDITDEDIREEIDRYRALRDGGCLPSW